MARAQRGSRDGGQGAAGASNTLGFVACLFVPLWVCLGLLLAMLPVLVGASEATAALGSSADAASARDAGALIDRSSAETCRLRRDVCEPSSSIEVAPEPVDEDEEAFETPRAACALAPVPAFDVLDLRPSSAPAVDSGRSMGSTGLGRGPPQRRR